VVAVPATVSRAKRAAADEVVSSVDGLPNPTHARGGGARRNAGRAITVTTSAAADARSQRQSTAPRAGVNASIGTASTAVRAAFGGDLATQFTGRDGLKDVLVISASRRKPRLGDRSDPEIRRRRRRRSARRDIATLVASARPSRSMRINRQTVVYRRGEHRARRNARRTSKMVLESLRD